MSFLQKLSTSIVVILFTTIVVLDVFVQPEYHFDDYPYFDYRGGFLLLAIIVVVLITIGIMKLGEIIKWNPVVPIVFYIITAAASGMKGLRREGSGNSGNSDVN